jgi:hypothetical protein
MKIVYGKDGFVTNVVNAPPVTFDGEVGWLVDDAVVVNVGDPFDVKDPQIDTIDVGAFRCLFRHENMIRQLVRAVRVNAAINTAATTAGLPTSANAPDLTLAQARAAFKALLP